MLRSTAFMSSLATLALGLFASLAMPGQEKKPAGAPPPPAAKAPEMPHGIRAWHVQIETGPKFDPKTPIMSQPGFEEHAKNIHAMADDGSLLVGGPIFETADSDKIIGGVLILKAKDEKAVREKFANDPFLNGGVMKIVSVHPMMAGLGAWVPKEKAEAGGH